MKKLRSPYRVKCRTCGNVLSLDLDLECVSSYERKMGPEMEYAAFYDNGCPECRADIMVRIGAWEYPEGQLTDYSVTLEGACEMEEPVFEDDFGI